MAQPTQRPAPLTTPAATARGGRSLWPVAALSALCLVFRLVHLRDLPIFCDESIYLRWAQLVRGMGVDGAHPWVSLVDPKPPLHFWLIALVFNWAADPLTAARALSAVAGALAIPLFMSVAVELARLPRRAGAAQQGPAPLSGRAWGLVTALLALFCPFLAFYQRLATADALFVAESLLIVWLSLLWSRLAEEGASRRTSWLAALALGMSLGVGLMTRQGISYTIFAVPVLCWALRAARAGKTRLLQPRLQFIAACFLAGLCWLPFLVADLPHWAQATAEERRGVGTPLTTRDYFQEVKRRVFYHEGVAGGSVPAASIIGNNAYATFIPGWSPEGAPNSGWFWIYLTPGVFLMALAGLVMLALRRWRVFAVLLAWFLLMLLPVIVLGHSVFARYVLAAALPLLLAASYCIAELTTWLLTARLPRVVGPLAAAGLWGIALVPAMHDLALQITDWPHQKLTVDGRNVWADRDQYISGWPAGLASQRAIAFLQERASAGPIIVLTDGGWGTSADAVWVYLSRNPNVQLYYTDDRVLKPAPDAPGSYLLKTDKFLYPPPQVVAFPHGVPIWYVLNMPAKATPEIVARVGLSRMSANLGPPQTFYGVDGPAADGVVIFHVEPAGP